MSEWKTRGETPRMLTLAPSTLILPGATSPAQTAEGSAVWDTDDDVLTIGTGSGRSTFGKLGSTAALAIGTAAAGSSVQGSRVDHVHATGAGTPAAVGTANATGSGPAAAMTDHVHAHETAHVAHDTIWDAAGDLAVGSGADTAARLAIGSAGAVLGVINSAVAWNAGSSFPASKATNDRFWRTDLGVECYWDGSRWLSTQIHTIAQDFTALSASSGNLSAIAPFQPGGNDLWLLWFEQSIYIQGGSALSGSHKWVSTLVSRPSGTTAATINWNSGAIDTYRSQRTTIGALLGTGQFVLDAVHTKTGTPGNIYTNTLTAYRVVYT